MLQPDAVTKGFVHPSRGILLGCYFKLMYFPCVLRCVVKARQSFVQPRPFVVVHILLFRCALCDVPHPIWVQLPCARNTVALWLISV